MIFTTGERVVGDDYVSHDIVLGIVYFYLTPLEGGGKLSDAFSSGAAASA